MNEGPQDERLIQEIRELRKDMGRWVRNSLFVFAGSVLLVCLFFGKDLSKGTKELLGEAGSVIGAGLLLVGFLYLVGLCFQSFFNFLRRRRYERESFAILSGRAPGSRRRLD